jgi:tRNA (cmo5U34)-methyltransferase
MADDARRVFEDHADEYDALRRRLVPCHDAFYGAAVDALDKVGRPLRRVLDLGAGTGALSVRVAAAHPDTELVLLDGSPAMLAHARAALGDRAGFVVADLRDPLPPGPFDAVVSALAIHHLDDGEKRALLGRVRDALTPGGVFVNAEQVLGETPEVDAQHLHDHRHASTALGASEEEWAAAMERMSHDRCATVDDQLRWMREAGLVDAGCPFRDGRFAVLTGVAP